jgi:hypothetical protein
MEIKKKKKLSIDNDKVKLKKSIESEEDMDNVDEKSKDDIKDKYKAFFKDIESIKFNEEYERLKDIIKLGESGRQSKMKLLSVLDDICYDTKVAGYLYIRARKECSNYEKLDFDIWMAKKRSEAYDPDVGGFTKNASVEKVDDWIKQTYANDYKSKIKKLLDLKLVRDAMEIFYEQFQC